MKDIKKVEREMPNGFEICKECGAVIATEFWEKHANIHWPEKTFGPQSSHFTIFYSVEPYYDQGDLVFMDYLRNMSPEEAGTLYLKLSKWFGIKGQRTFMRSNPGRPI